MSFKVLKIIDWFKKYDNKLLRVNYQENYLNIHLQLSSIPHLLGLHYAEIRDFTHKRIKGKELVGKINYEQYEDEFFYDRIKLYNKDKLKAVKDRVETFIDFFENLENAKIVKMTHLTTQIESKLLLIQYENEKYLHLGIKESELGLSFIDMLDLDVKQILETYFSNKTNRYFKNTDIEFKIDSLEIYDFENNKFLPFSFDEEKNQKLLMEFHQKLEEEKTIENEEDLEIGI